MKPTALGNTLFYTSFNVMHHIGITVLQPLSCYSTRNTSFYHGGTRVELLRPKTLAPSRTASHGMKTRVLQEGLKAPKPELQMVQLTVLTKLELIHLPNHCVPWGQPPGTMVEP